MVKTAGQLLKYALSTLTSAMFMPVT